MNQPPESCSETPNPTGQGNSGACFYLCTSDACDCSAAACRGSQIPPNLSFDLTISGATADGTISGELGDHQVHFARAK